MKILDIIIQYFRKLFDRICESICDRIASWFCK